MTESVSTGTSSSIMKNLQKPWVIGTIALVAAGVAYAVAFDARRRLDPKFRKQLRKQQKKVEQQTREIKLTSRSSAMSDIPSIESILSEPLPTSPEEKERYFMDQLTRGEAISKQGPQYYENSSACFYKALKVYPSPAELLMLYQRTLPEEIFKLVMGMISNEVKKRQEIYYVVFPPPEMNVRTKEKKLLSNDSSRVLVATRDFEVGEVIYTEEPLIGSLQPSLLSTNKYCHYCFKLIPDTFRPISKRTKLAYCSDPCENIAWEKYDQLMYSDYARSEGSTTHALVQLCTEKDTVIPLFIAKFLAYMVYEDQMKNQQVNQEEFGVWDHLERMKYMDLPMNEKEKKIQKKMQAAVGAKIPGFDEFLTDERYVILKGKFLYNQYSVANGEAENALAKEMQRCALSSAVGVGFYPVSTYLTHSCVPNTRIDFANQDSRLHLIATKPIAAGDQLYVSFVNAEGSYAERKKALSKWRFNCVCEKCTNEELDESRT